MYIKKFAICIVINQSTQLHFWPTHSQLVVLVSHSMLVICLDESSKQLLETRQFMGRDGTHYQDNEDIRHEVRDIYLTYDPLVRKRHCFWKKITTDSVGQK